MRRLHYNTPHDKKKEVIIMTNINAIKINIFVNTWKNYNENGADGGRWLALPMDQNELEELLENIAEEIGDDDPEWTVHDFSGDCFDFEISEYDDIVELNDLAQQLSELDELEAETVAAYLEAVDSDLSVALAELSECVYYPGYTLEDVAYELVEELCGNADEFLLRYFDYEAFARDLAFDGYYETANGVLYVG